MKLTDEQKKKAWLTFGAIAVIVVAILIIQGFRMFIGTRVSPVPSLGESIVGGRLKSNVLQQGANTLEFTAKTRDGRVISDTVTFEVLPPDPYGPYDPFFLDNPPDPYAP